MESWPGDALEYIASRLTQPQRRILVAALVQANDSDFVTVRDASEHSVRALKQEPAPLVLQADMIRFLSPLGREVARHLNRTGAYEIGQVAA